MRIDKFLKTSRLIKRRTIAKEACEQARIFINDKSAKPGADVKIDDIIQIHFGSSVIKAKVISVPEHTSKDQASAMYEIIDEQRIDRKE
jgi:ribosomal 50S subunit-recycling heat shock protein